VNKLLIPEVGSYRISYLLLYVVSGRQVVRRENINSYYPWSIVTVWSKCRTTKGKGVTSTLGDELHLVHSVIQCAGWQTFWLESL